VARETNITRGQSLSFYFFAVVDGLFDLSLELLFLDAVLLLCGLLSLILIYPPVPEVFPSCNALLLQLAPHPSLPAYLLCLAALALDFILLDSTLVYVDEFLMQMALLHTLLISCT
jgi:hypothetical protein